MHKYYSSRPTFADRLIEALLTGFCCGMFFLGSVKAMELLTYTPPEPTPTKAELLCDRVLVTTREGE